MNRTVRVDQQEGKPRSSMALDSRITSPDYLESEARARIGKLFRTKKSVNGIARGKTGRVVDVDKIRIYRSTTHPAPDFGQIGEFSRCIDAWHLTLEWNQQEGPTDVFRKSEVEQFLSEVI